MYNTHEENKAIAEAVQSMWLNTLGVEVKVVDQEWGEYLDTLKTGTPWAVVPHIWRLSWCADYADQNNWVHEVFNNQEGMNRLRRGCLDRDCTETEQLEFDRITKEAGAEQDPERRKALYKRAEEILSEEEAAYIPLFYYTYVRVTKPWLTRTFRQLGGQHWDKWAIDWEAKKAATGID